jgi:hypothetical protein
MPSISWNLIQDRATEFAAKWDGETYEKGESQSFWSDFLYVFGIDRRRHGAYFEYAIKKLDNKQGFIDMFWPDKLLAEQKSGGHDLNKAIAQAHEYLYNIPDHDLPQAIVVSDFATFQFVDLETREQTDFTLEQLPKNVHLFAFLINEQGKRLAEENPVNRKAAESMADLHNELRDNNYTGHDLEVLLVRLVFCMFADDSGIFEREIFEDYIYSRTEVDGSDLGPRLVKLFEVLNTPQEQRQANLDQDLTQFEYINGGLFADSISIPDFDHKMRQKLLDAMELDWSVVSPAIFGSMFQGVMDEDARRNLGAHYTSEKNILKVIKPLFLDELYEEFTKANTKPKLHDLHNKLANLKFLDPACGCGNFLVITYRELRRLEHKVIAKIYGKNVGLLDVGEYGLVKVDVDQMYGIEIEEFPALIAETALWLTDHQMNMEFSSQAHKVFKRLPLKKSAHIHNKNALQLDWQEVIEPEELNYILGNPPFLGKQYQTNEQKADFSTVWSGVKGAGVLDFVTAWYRKAAQYINGTDIHVALVSTNSISQGEQVSILWEELFKNNISIDFAHRTFQWSNDAKGVAGVHCIIVGFSQIGRPVKLIYEYNTVKLEPTPVRARNINPYLIDAPDLVIGKRSRPLCNVPPMNYGSMPNDGGQLLLDQDEANELLEKEPLARPWIRKFIMGNEFINNIQRYCLWLVDIQPQELTKLPLIKERVERVRIKRASSTRKTTQELAYMPNLFGEIRQPEAKYLALPRVSSENRRYIPMDFLSENIIAGDKVYTLPNATHYQFATLTSSMHMAWMRVTAGRLESRYSYTNLIVYNNFPWPENVSSEEKERIQQLGQQVLDARSNHKDATLADLYDPLTMPADLFKAHKALDKAVDRLYRQEPFTDDTDRVAFLFKKYQVLTG